ncbi:MAG: TIGR03435 family protein [Terriglobia bacterium]
MAVKPTVFATRPLASLFAVLLSAGGLIPGWIAIAQTNAAWPTSFEVASIRPVSPANRVIGFYPRPGRFWATNVRLQDLIGYAYSLNPVQLQTHSLPSWVRSRRYTIKAVMPSGMPHLPPRDRGRVQGQMLRSLLAERFGLKVHWTTKLLPAYDLVVAKGGAKMKLWSNAEYAVDHHQPTSMRFGIGSYTAWGNPSWQIAGNLTAVLGRRVIDQTGLTGRYDFNLTWTPWRSGASGEEGFGSGAAEEGVTPAADSSGPSIFTAIREQLGLKLKPTKAPVEVLVVDHVEPPTPN